MNVWRHPVTITIPFDTNSPENTASFNISSSEKYWDIASAYTSSTALSPNLAASIKDKEGRDWFMYEESTWAQKNEEFKSFLIYWRSWGR
jgi:hypothetical protein